MARGRGRPRRSKVPVEDESEERQEVEEGAIDVEDVEEVKVNGDAEDESESESEKDDDEDPREQLWESFKEEHYETVEQLPLYLHRTYNLIRDLDVKNQANQREIQSLLRAYLECRRRAEPVTQVKEEPNIPKVEGCERKKEGNIQDEVEKAKESVPINQPSASEPVRQDVVMEDTKPEGWPTQETDIVAKDGSVQNQSWTEPPEPPEPPTLEEQRTLITRLAVLIDEWVQNCEEKVNLTKAAYDSTDRHIRMLDTVINEQRNIPYEPPDQQEEEGSNCSPEEEEEMEVDDETSDQRNSKRRNTRQQARATAPAQGGNKKKKKAPPPAPDPPASRQTAPPSRMNPIDMDVMQDEPKYCYCNQVSYGEMILCDNKHCAREWFHLACAGFTKPPSDNVKWFCEDCSAALGRKTRRKR